VENYFFRDEKFFQDVMWNAELFSKSHKECGFVFLNFACKYGVFKLQNSASSQDRVIEVLIMLNIFCSTPRFGVEMLRMFAKPNPSFRRKTFMFPQTNNLQE
jgi:hypothetical protein